jgi:hypothetical protein
MSAMTFYRNRIDAGLWVVLALFKIVLAGEQLHRHGFGDRFALLPLIVWSLLLSYWAWVAATRWSLNAGALEQRSIGTGVVTVPYTQILSVDPVSSGYPGKQIAITYGTQMFADQIQRMTIATRKQADLLAELKRRAPQASFNL